MKNDCSYGSSAVTGVAMSQPENGFDGEVGIKVELKTSVEITALGRFWYYGNSERHRLSVYNENGSRLVSVTVDMGGGCADRYGFKYARLSEKLKLPVGTYYFVTEERSGGDLWLGSTTVITYEDSVMTLSAHVRIENGGISESQTSKINYASGAVNFLYD